MQTVLLVEDDQDVAEAMIDVLVDEGYLVAHASNGREALDLLRHTDLSPSVILLDLMMPGLDGFGFIEELRARTAWHDVPIVVMTAKDLTDEDRRRLDGSIRAIIRKAGGSRDTFLAEVRELLAPSLRRPRPG